MGAAEVSPLDATALRDLSDETPAGENLELDPDFDMARRATPFLESVLLSQYSPGALEKVLAEFFQATEFKTALTPSTGMPPSR